MRRLSKAFLVFTSLLYTAFLFYVYAYFKEQELIYVAWSDNTFALNNNTLFYGGLIIPFIVALLGIVLAKIVDRQNSGTGFYLKSDHIKTRLSGWALGIGGVFNLFAAAILSIIFFSNNDEGVTLSGYVPFVVASLGLLIIWLLWLPIILLKNK